MLGGHRSSSLRPQKLPDDAANSALSPRIRSAGGMRGPAIAALVTSDCGHMTPRKYIRTMHLILTSLNKHISLLSPAVQAALQALAAALEEAARTHSKSAEGKVHHYLREDMEVARLQAAAAAAAESLSAAGKASAYADTCFKVAVADAIDKLTHSRCVLPEHQLQFINQFRSLHRNLDPSEVVSDSVQKQAEHVVREVVKEVYGPFFNDEVLSKEVSHMERAAKQIDPQQQQMEAACVKLLASSLMLLDADDQEESSDLEGPIMREDPFALPALPDSNPNTGEGGNRLVITISGEDGVQKAVPLSILSSPLFTGSHPSQAESASEEYNPNDEEVDEDDEEEGSQQQQTSTPDSMAAAASSRSKGVRPGPGLEAERLTLEDFLEQSSLPDNKKACTFHAQMQLPEGGLERLASFVQSSGRVRGLSLAHNAISDAGTQLLCAAVLSGKSVRALDLRHNCLGDEGAVALAQLLQSSHRLTTLQLAHNNIGDRGAQALAEALQASTSLEKLSLHGNSIGSVGCQALVQALGVNRSLKVLEFLPGNLATPRDIKALAAAIKDSGKAVLANMFGSKARIG